MYKDFLRKMIKKNNTKRNGMIKIKIVENAKRQEEEKRKRITTGKNQTCTLSTFLRPAAQ